MAKKFILLFILSFFINSCQNSSEYDSQNGDENLNTINTFNNQKSQFKEDENQVNLKSILEEKINLDSLRKLVCEDLKDFKSLKVYMQTSKFKIWVDQKQDGSFRYASWPISKSIDSDPDIILENGTINHEGSGGNHWYEFKNATTKYICDINVLGKSSEDAFLLVKDGNKILVDQSAIFISPFSKVISKEVIPTLLKNYDPGNYYFDEYSFVKSLHNAVLENDDIEEGDIHNLSIETRMFLISGINPIIGYDDYNIAHYNNSFIDWIAVNLIPSKNFNIGNYSVEGYYNKKFSRFFRKLISLYWMLEKKGFEKQAKAYKDFYTKNEYGASWYLTDLYAKEIVSEDINVANRKSYDINALLAGFWLRRYIHNNSDKIYKVLENIVIKFDSYWIKDAKVLANYTDLFIPNTEIQSEAIKFYKNNYKLVDYSAESTLEEEVDFNDTEHPFSQVTYKFEECNDTTTHRLFSDYIHDNVRPVIPLLNDSKWLAIENRSSLTINNPTPVSEFSWNSTLILNKDSVGKLNKISYANRGNGGGHEIEIQRWDNYCELTYFGFAD